MTNKIKKIELKIRKAFNCTVSIESLSQEEAEELNYGINKYDSNTVKKLLPLLLIKNMQALAKGKHIWSSDGLVYFLDGCMLGRRPAGGTSKENSSYAYLLEIQKQTFSEFTSQQAEAILLWLEDIAYPAHKDHCLVDVESAIRFWKEKIVETK